MCVGATCAVCTLRQMDYDKPSTNAFIQPDCWRENGVAAPQCSHPLGNAADQNPATFVHSIGEKDTIPGNYIQLDLRTSTAVVDSVRYQSRQDCCPTQGQNINVWVSAGASFRTTGLQCNSAPLSAAEPGAFVITACPRVPGARWVGRLPSAACRAPPGMVIQRLSLHHHGPAPFPSLAIRACMPVADKDKDKPAGLTASSCLQTSA